MSNKNPCMEIPLGSPQVCTLWLDVMRDKTLWGITGRNRLRQDIFGRLNQKTTLFEDSIFITL